MQIYNNNSWKLSQVKEIWFNLEKDMQSLIEINLKTKDIFNVNVIE